MHIPPFDNQNKPIIDINDDHVPLTYFNIVKLKKGELLQPILPVLLSTASTYILSAAGLVRLVINPFLQHSETLNVQSTHSPGRVKVPL